MYYPHEYENIRKNNNLSSINIQQEYENIRKNKNLSSIGCTVTLLNKNDFYKWKASYVAKNSAYENMLIELQINIPKNYPNSAPQAYFISKIYHPNVDLSNGRVCIASINNWKSEYNIMTILFSIYMILYNPNPNNPLNSEAANLYKEDKNKFKQKVKEYIGMKNVIQ